MKKKKLEKGILSPLRRPPTFLSEDRIAAVFLEDLALAIKFPKPKLNQAATGARIL